MPRVLFEDLSLARFLRLPEAKPALEYLDGKVVQKVSPKMTHSVLQTTLGARLLDFGRSRGLGRPYNELRCTFGGRSLVPDVCFFARGRLPKDEAGRRLDDVFLPPDLMIEILSPGQTVKGLSARLRRSVVEGVRLGWLVQPRQSRVFVFRPGQPREALGPGAVLDGGDVLPGLALPIDEVFGWLLED